MADDDGRALELQQRLLQRIARPQIEVVGRLVEHQHVDALGHQPGQGRPALLAAGQVADTLIHLIADQAETAQQVAHALLDGVGVGVRPDGADHRLVGRQRLQVLIVVAELDQMAALHLAAVRLPRRPAARAAASSCRCRWAP